MDTQTVPPTNLQTTVSAVNTIWLHWTPILYTEDGGWYVVSYRPQEGPYHVHGRTDSKYATGYIVDGLSLDTSYDYRVRSYTPAHGRQHNNLWSDYSQVVTSSPMPFTLLYVPLFLVRQSPLCTIQTEIPQAECEALVALYNSTDGDNWTDNDGWTGHGYTLELDWRDSAVADM